MAPLTAPGGASIALGVLLGAILCHFSGVGVVIVLAIPIKVGIGGAVLPKHVVADRFVAIRVVAEVADRVVSASSGGASIDLFGGKGAPLQRLVSLRW